MKKYLVRPAQIAYNDRLIDGRPARKFISPLRRILC